MSENFYQSSQSNWNFLVACNRISINSNYFFFELKKLLSLQHIYSYTIVMEANENEYVHLMSLFQF